VDDFPKTGLPGQGADRYRHPGGVKERGGGRRAGEGMGAGISSRLI